MVSSGQLPRIVLAGQFQQGKSTFVNCILKGRFAIEGRQTETTRSIVRYVYNKDCFEIRQLLPNGRRRLLGCDLTVTTNSKRDGLYEIGVPAPALVHCNLVDVPGWGANDRDNKLAVDSLEDASFLIYVTGRTLEKMDFEFLREVQKHHVYFTVVLNRKDTSNPDPEDEVQRGICRNIFGQLKQRELLRYYIQYPCESHVASVNLKWAKYGVGLLGGSLDAEDESQLQQVLHELSDLQGDLNKAFAESRLPEFSLFVRHTVSVLEGLRWRVVDTDALYGCDVRERVAGSIRGNLISLLKRRFFTEGKRQGGL